jgi:hypothetical protein
MNLGLEDDLYSVGGEEEGRISVSPSPLEPQFPPSQLVPKLYTEKQVDTVIFLIKL